MKNFYKWMKKKVWFVFLRKSLNPGFRNNKNLYEFNAFQASYIYTYYLTEGLDWLFFEKIRTGELQFDFNFR